MHTVAKAVAGGFTAALLATGLSPPVQAGAVITYGNTSLGVNDSGELNFGGLGPGGFLTYGVYRAGVGDAISPGCFCEGWGVATTYGGSTTSGFANRAAGSGGLTGGVFGSTSTTATSTIGLIGAPLQVTHAFGPSLLADIFQVNVSIANGGDQAAENVIYRRVMDWDVPPTEFNEYVTHQGVEANLVANGGNVLYASDNGFASGDPFIFPSFLEFGTVNTDFVDSGPSDHGSVFDFAFGNINPGESRTFNIFYGSRESEPSAVAALAGLGVNLYSLGQNAFTGLVNGTPATFLFAFGGVGGVEPGTVETVPILPFVPAPGVFDFPSPTPRRWYDPPFASGFTYTLPAGGEFFEVGAPSAASGFAGPFDVVVGGTTVGSVAAGGTFSFRDPTFVALGLGPITSFALTGIAPLLDTAAAGFATAFPTFLDFTAGAPSFTMTAIIAAVPEPGPLALLAVGGLALLLLSARLPRREGHLTALG